MPEADELRDFSRNVLQPSPMKSRGGISLVHRGKVTTVNDGNGGIFQINEPDDPQYERQELQPNETLWGPASYDWGKIAEVSIIDEHTNTLMWKTDWVEQESLVEKGNLVRFPLWQEFQKSLEELCRI